jgi:hypothetical protein
MLAMLPVRDHIGARFVEMDMLIDMVHPGQWNEVMVLAVRRALFCELDPVGVFEVVDLADHLPIG